MDFNGLYGILGFQMIQWIFTNEVIIAFLLKMEPTIYFTRTIVVF